MARAQGLLVDDGDHYRLSAPGAIPATLAGAVGGPARRPRARTEAGAPARRGDGRSDARTTWPPSGSPNAAAALRALVENGLMRHAPEGRYDTVDSLLREVAYETLPRNVRGELHRRAATFVGGTEERARHLDRAAGYLPDDRVVAAEAAEALAQAGQELFVGARLLDAMRLLERAVALGCRSSSALLDLAKVQSLCRKPEDVFATLAMVDDDPDDPTVAVERDHTAANAKVFTDPAQPCPSSRRSRRAGESSGSWTRRRGGTPTWASRISTSAAWMRRRASSSSALALFEQIGDRVGAVAASSFLCLARPTDRRVPEWLAEALEFADAGRRPVQAARGRSPP